MATASVNYWKRLWRWTTSGSLTKEEISCVINCDEVVEGFRLGVECYKPLKSESFSQLQSKHPNESKLLTVVQGIQHYIDVDCFQIWEILKHYLCDTSYGTPSKALNNVFFIDARPSFLLPKVWSFYYSERLYMFRLLQYIIQFKNDSNHKYNEEFIKIFNKIGMKELKSSLITQFEKLLATAPPPRKIQIDFSCETVRRDWALSNLREQLAILQILLLLATEECFTEAEFTRLFKLFRKHNFGNGQGYNNFLDEQHRAPCLRIMYIEVCLFVVILDKTKINNISSWIESTKETVEFELCKLQINPEHSIMLMSWMLFTLQSDQHAKLFESHYQQFGATALRMGIFECLHEMLNSSVFSDKSKCSSIVRQRIFEMLNDLCDKFDGDGTLSLQPGIMELTADLLKTEDIAKQFWMLHQKQEQFGVVSLWNTALEYFPYNFSSLSILAAGLAQAGTESVRNLIGELKNLPVYTEIYNLNAVPIMSNQLGDAIVKRDYYPLCNQSYRIEEGSIATVMERKEGTMIHFRTPYTYWTILNHEIEKALDRKQHQKNIAVTLQRVYEGTKLLKGILNALVLKKEIPKSLVAPSEGVFDVLVRFMRTDSPPLTLLVECLEVCTALVPMFPKEIYLRLINTGLLPRVLNQQLTHVEYANGTSFDSAAIGSYMITIEQPSRSYKFLRAYINMLCAFHEAANDEKITKDVILPGLILILREVFPNINGWRYENPKEKQDMLEKCVIFLNMVLQQSKDKEDSVIMLKKTCIHSLLCMENALELLRIVSIGNEQLENKIRDETNWISGNGLQNVSTMQRCLALVMFALRLKHLVTKNNELTALEHLIFSQNKQKDMLKVVPRIASYINHSFNKNLPVLCCRLLKKFAESFQMSLFASLEMSAYQVRVMFLDRLRDKYETYALKVAILEFVATSVGKQPGLTEAFFMMNYEKAKVKDCECDEVKKEAKIETQEDDSFDGILGYMADYLGTVKADVKLLQSKLLGCIMSLFHELWKNNMQILVKKLRENPKFWEHVTSPLFSEIQPGLRTYSQIFNVLGIELFVSRGRIDKNLHEMLEQFFDVNKKNLDTWIDYIFSFKGRNQEEEVFEQVPVWLGLLTSWKDFTTIFCKCLPISLNIAHKSKLVAPCLTALLNELDDIKDGRVVVILAELYVIMLGNWKDDCFDNRKHSAKQIDCLLTNAAAVYECLHPRAKRAILSIGTVAINSLDYEIKANSVTAQNIIRAVTNINSLELEKLLDDIKELPKENSNKTEKSEEIASIVLSLAMLEQCLDLYDDVFSGLSQWFQSTRYINKMLSFLQMCLQNHYYYNTSLAALRCLTAYARGPFSKDLLLSDVDQFLWLPLLPPKIDGNNTQNSHTWKPEEWWKVYSYSLDFISTMVLKHGQFFANDAITFVGVHLEYLMEAILMPRQVFSIEALNLCASTLHLIVQLVKFEARWRIQNINSLVGIMRSISACVHQCVTIMLRSRRSSDPAIQSADESVTQPVAPAQPSPLHRTLEVLHMATLCLLAFSPDLLSLLADPGLDLERWQPLVELNFGAPKINYEPYPQLTFGTLLSAISLLSRALRHAYHAEDLGSSRSPRRRLTCSCSPGDSKRATRSESLTSVSSATSAAQGLDERLLAPALEAITTLLAEQALLAVRDSKVPQRLKQLVRRELASELTVFHDFVRKRVLCAAHARPHLHRNKLGVYPLATDETEAKMIEEARREQFDDEIPPPPPPKRSHDSLKASMREFVLRKHYLDKCAQTPIKDPPSPVSHSTPTSDKKKDASRSSKRVSWAETMTDSDEVLDSSLQEIEPAYSNLTDVQINSDEEYFHLMSVMFLYICQTEL